MHQGPALSVWISADKGYEGVMRMGTAFERATGVPVRVEHPENGISKFEQAAAAGKGPDIWIWTHDRAGSWAQSGLIRPIAPASRVRDAIAPLAWSAWQLAGRSWGWPLAVESVALIVNLDLVPEPPTTWEEVIAIDRRLRTQGRRAIAWAFNEFYYAYGLVSAGGGYAFARRPDGSWSASDTGIANEGSRRGMVMLKRLVDEGVVPRTTTYAESEASMNEGRVAMTINGPWAWNNLRKSRLRVAAFALPGFSQTAGATGTGAALVSPGRPMVGVPGAMVTTTSRNPVLAAEFIERWLLSPAGLRAMHAHVPLGVPADLNLLQELRQGDVLVAGTQAAAALGEPMPNIPEMARYWTAMNAAVQGITQGRENVDDALRRAASRVSGRGDGRTAASAAGS
jgi:maltose/maltodextrin transport system substrate-binding protein